MKKIMFFAALAVVMLTSCKKGKSIADFSFSTYYNQDAAIQNVPGYSYGDPLPAGGVDMSFTKNALATNVQQYFDGNHLNGKNVRTADFTSGYLTLMAGTNFDFLDKIEVYVSAGSLPEVLVAYQYDIPKGQQRVELISNGQNMRKYIRNETITGRIEAHLNAVPEPKTKLHVSGQFDMLANPFVNYD